VAEPLKIRGMAELADLRARARRQHRLGRITRPDLEYIEQRLNDLEARIVGMQELGKDGEER